MTETRKLAAILRRTSSATAGSPAPTRIARWRGCGRLRSDLIDPTIAVHKGRVVKRTGDGALVEFRSVVDAVRCAIEVQNAMVERNAGLPPERRIEFRIGIHLGDVVEESDGDLMGDGVNIAARLEGIAEPGAICLSEDAYRQVKRGSISRSPISASQAQEHRRADPRLSRGRAGARPNPSRGAPSRGRRSSGAARQAVDRGAAVPEHERRPGAGIFRRRHGRGHHHRPVAHQMAVRDRAQFELHLQGQGGRHQAGRARTRRALCARRRRAQGGQPAAHHRAADRGRDRRASLGRPLRRRARRRFRPAGPDHRPRGRRRRAEPAQVGDRTRPGESVPKTSTPTTSICALCRTWIVGDARRTPGSPRAF